MRFMPAAARRFAALTSFLLPSLLASALALLLPAVSYAQTDCEAGNGALETAEPKVLSVAEILHRLGAAESAVKLARNHYNYRRDVLLQTLNGNDVTGEFHQVAKISYDAHGGIKEEVVLSPQNTLRGIQVTADDQEDVRTFMPLLLTAEDLPQYNLNFLGQRHVDDLDTYEFHVAAKKEEKGRRYFEGRVWVDAQDFQVVKLCGKTVPEKINVKKHESPQLHPTFVTYRQLVDGHWFPAYTRSDDTLQFKSGAVHLRETVKYTGYTRLP